MGKLIFHTDSKEALYIIGRLKEDKKLLNTLEKKVREVTGG